MNSSTSCQSSGLSTSVLEQCKHLPEPATIEEIRAARERFFEDDFAAQLLESVPTLIMVLNASRQVIAANQHLLNMLQLESVEEILGQRPGDIMHCVTAADGSEGCGRAPACEDCGALETLLTAVKSGESVEGECHLRTSESDPLGLDLEVRVTPLHFDGLDLYVLGIRDVTETKQMRALERLFFHDVLNVVFDLRALTEIPVEEQGEIHTQEYTETLRALSEQLTEEVTAQRSVTAAEHGEMVLSPREVSLEQIFSSLRRTQGLVAAELGRRIAWGECPQGQITTDPVLLRRVLGNLIRNALEATERGGQVRVWAAAGQGGVSFSVNNAGTIPESVQRQMFTRSFSTKGEVGRGLGLYSVKLISQNCLQGKVEYTTESDSGTTFTVSLPWRLPL